MADGAFHGAAADGVAGRAEGLVLHPVTVGGEVAEQIVHGFPLARRALMRPEKPQALDDLIDPIGGQPIELGGAPGRRLLGAVTERIVRLHERYGGLGNVGRPHRVPTVQP